MTAATVSSAVAARESGPVSVMFASRRQFAAVLPKSVDADAFLGTMAGALYASVGGRSPTLMECAQASPDSLYTALMRCAALGHMPGTDEFYLTPRKKGGRPQVLGIEGYRGIVERMYRSGAVKSVIVREVCAKDQFRYVEGIDDRPVHSFGGEGATGADFFGENGSRDRGAMVGVYAYAILTTGAVSRVVVLSRDDVMAAREASDSKNSDYSPWNKLDGGEGHPEFTGRSMWWKTAARRLEPWVPTSAEYRREQLRASAAASRAAEPAVFHRIENGQGVPSDAAEAVDAEIVEDQPADGAARGHAARAGLRDPTPASGASSATGSETTQQAAPAPTAPPARQSGEEAPSSRGESQRTAAIARVSALLGGLPLGEEADVAALIRWLTGAEVTPELMTISQARTVASFLSDAHKAANGDPELTASRIWEQFRAVQDQAGGTDGN